MPFKILCSCGVSLLAGDDLESFKLACPECGSYTLLPTIPDPYKLPSNAEMIAIEDSNYEAPIKQKEKVSTVRKRGAVPRGSGGGGGRQQKEEMSNTNIFLILAIIVVVFVIAIIALASTV